MSVFGGSGDLWSNLFLFLIMLMGLYKVRSRRVENLHRERCMGEGGPNTAHTRAFSGCSTRKSAPVTSSSDASSQPPGEYAALHVLICRWLCVALGDLYF